MADLGDDFSEDRKFRKELVSGTTALVLLRLLDLAAKPMYGYEIAKAIEQANAKAPVKLGTLYPVLRSLEVSGLLGSRVEPSVTGPPRRYYEITGDGREALKRWGLIWKEIRGFVDGVLEDNDHVK